MSQRLCDPSSSPSTCDLVVMCTRALCVHITGSRGGIKTSLQAGHTIVNLPPESCTPPVIGVADVSRPYYVYIFILFILCHRMEGCRNVYIRTPFCKDNDQLVTGSYRLLIRSFTNQPTVDKTIDLSTNC